MLMTSTTEAYSFISKSLLQVYQYHKLLKDLFKFYFQQSELIVSTIFTKRKQKGKDQNQCNEEPYLIHDNPLH